MNPSTENIAKPDMKLTPLFKTDNAMQSLQ